MSISTEVNIDVLNDLYALSAFHGLRAADPNDQWNEQMTEEAELDLPNATVTSHHDDPHHHIKSNPALEAMQKAVGGSGGGTSFDSSHHSSTNLTAAADAQKAHKQHKSHEGQLDHSNGNGSDHLHTPNNKSSEDLSTLHEYLINRAELNRFPNDRIDLGTTSTGMITMPCWTLLIHRLIERK